MKMVKVRIQAAERIKTIFNVYAMEIMGPWRSLDSASAF